MLRFHITAALCALLAAGSAAAQPPPGKTLSLELRDATLGQVLALLAQASQQRFDVSPAVRADRRLSVRFADTGVETALYYVLQANDLELRAADHGAVAIVPAARAAESERVVVGMPSLLIDVSKDAADIGHARAQRLAGEAALRQAAAASMRQAVATAAATVQKPPVQADALLDWKVRARSRVGSNFTVQIMLRARAPLASLPLTIAFDGKALEVVRIEEGDAFKAGGARARFDSRVDPNGSIAIEAAALDVNPHNANKAMEGSVASITFRAVREAAAAPVQLTSGGARTAAGAAIAVAVPLLHTVHVQP